MSTTLNERFISILKEKNISKADYALSIGKSKQLISNWAKNINTVSLDAVTGLLNQFPDIDARWLLTGESRNYSGEQIKSIVSEHKTPYDATTRDKDMIIELQKEMIDMQRQEITRLKEKNSDNNQQH